MDNLTREQRRFNMSQIHARETEPEKSVRSILHRRGYRFRKNVRGLPGSPDIVLSKYRTVVFINGCFWHKHAQCARAVMPKTNSKYWRAKLRRNSAKDKEKEALLMALGWEVVTVWECEIKNDIESVIAKILKSLTNHAVLSRSR